MDKTEKKVKSWINKNLRQVEKLNNLIEQIDDDVYQRMTLLEKVKLRGSEIVEYEAHQELARAKNNEFIYIEGLEKHHTALTGLVGIHESLVKKYC